MPGWDSTLKSAQKVLGDKAKIPPVPNAIQKAAADLDKAWDAFDKTREELKKMVLKVKKAIDGCTEEVEQYQDKLDEDALGLDLKDKDDQKKIKDARKILHDGVQESLDHLKSQSDNLRLLDKHLMGLASFALEMKGLL